MIKRWGTSVLIGLFIASGLATVVGASQASAANGCVDVEVVFARGTVETAPPVGVTGLAFGEAVRGAVPGQSVRVYGVNYPASGNFSDRLRFAHNVLQGVNDTQRRINYLASQCPDTRIVLGGYSQGAAVIGFALHNGIDVPEQYSEYARYAPPSLPAEVADNVAAVVLYGAPSERFIRDIGAPPIEIGPLYQGKTVEYCIEGDNICNGAPVAGPNALHLLYPVNGMAVEGARYAARRI